MKRPVAGDLYRGVFAFILRCVLMCRGTFFKDVEHAETI